jgi:tetratricopeptide (TPR) repeat protein
MTRILLFTLLFLCCRQASAQSIRLLFADKNYAEIVKQYTDKEKDLDNEEIYLLGLSYFHTGEDEKAIYFYDKAIAKGFEDADVFFFKGISYRYLDKMPDALAAFDMAARKDSMNQQYACEKALTYYSMKKYEEALGLYENAKKLPNTYQAPWYMIPHIWFMQGKDADALKGWYEGLEKISKDNHFYALTLMDIARVESRLNKDHGKAINAYLKILNENATDYIASEALMVVYNKSKKKEPADSIFQVLKKAFEEKQLEGNMMKYKRVKVNEYEWNKRNIFVYKNFIPPAKMIDIMYVGYLMDSTGEKVERIFQTEQTIQLEDRSPKHILCEVWVNGKGRANYGIGWPSDEITTDEFMSLITEVLNGKLKPVASSTFK